MCYQSNPLSSQVAVRPAFIAYSYYRLVNNYPNDAETWFIVKTNDALSSLLQWLLGNKEEEEVWGIHVAVGVE